MARAYSDDLRGRVLEAVAGGASARAAGERFGIGVATAIVWARRHRQGGETQPRGRGGRRGSRLDAHAEAVEGMIDDQPDITLDEMVVRLADERSVDISRSALSAWLRARNWTFKKSPPMRWSRIAPTS